MAEVGIRALPPLLRAEEAPAESEHRPETAPVTEEQVERVLRVLAAADRQWALRRQGARRRSESAQDIPSRVLDNGPPPSALRRPRTALRALLRFVRRPR
jgi:hypothetical protein